MKFNVDPVDLPHIMGVPSSYLDISALKQQIFTKKTREKHALCNIQMVSSTEVVNMEVF